MSSGPARTNDRGRDLAPRDRNRRTPVTSQDPASGLGPEGPCACGHSSSPPLKTSAQKEGLEPLRKRWKTRAPDPRTAPASTPPTWSGLVFRTAPTGHVRACRSHVAAAPRGGAATHSRPGALGHALPAGESGPDAPRPARTGAPALPCGLRAASQGKGSNGVSRAHKSGVGSRERFESPREWSQTSSPASLRANQASSLRRWAGAWGGGWLAKGEAEGEGMEARFLSAFCPPGVKQSSPPQLGVVWFRLSRLWRKEQRRRTRWWRKFCGI